MPLFKNESRNKLTSYTPVSLTSVIIAQRSSDQILIIRRLTKKLHREFLKDGLHLTNLLCFLEETN
jgi:hypothetical protein